MFYRIDYLDLNKLENDFLFLKNLNVFYSAGSIKPKRKLINNDRINQYVQSKILDKNKIYEILLRLDKSLFENNNQLKDLKLYELPHYIKTIIDLFICFENNEIKKKVFFSSAGMHVPSLLIAYEIINLLLKKGIVCVELSYPPHDIDSKLFDFLLSKPIKLESIENLKMGI